MQDKIILGILNLLGGRSAYDLKKYMERSTNHFYNSSLGSIHPALRKLEELQQVTAAETVENGRAKKVYSITEIGKETFINWLQEDIAIGKSKDDLLLRVFFFSDLETGKRKSVVKAYLARLEEHIGMLEAIESSIEPDSIPPEYRETGQFQLTTLKFGIDYYRFIQTWYTNFLSTLK